MCSVHSCPGNVTGFYTRNNHGDITCPRQNASASADGDCTDAMCCDKKCEEDTGAGVADFDCGSFGDWATKDGANDILCLRDNPTTNDQLKCNTG